MDTPKCFQRDDLLGERNFAGSYAPTVRWYSTYHDDFTTQPAAALQDSLDDDAEQLVVQGEKAPEADSEDAIDSAGMAMLGVGAVVAGGGVLALVGWAVRTRVRGRRGARDREMTVVAGAKKGPEAARRTASLSNDGEGGSVESRTSQEWMVVQARGSDSQADDDQDVRRRLSSHGSVEALIPADSLARAPSQNPFETGARGRDARKLKSAAR